MLLEKQKTGLALAIAAVFLISTVSWADDVVNFLETSAGKAVGALVALVVGAPAEVGAVKLNLKEQALELVNVQIANPKGFADVQKAIIVNNVRIVADPKVLLSEKPLVSHLVASGVTVNSELTTSGSNLMKLLDHAKRFKAPQFGPEKKWIVQKGIVRDITVNSSTPLPGGGNQKKIEQYEFSMGGESSSNAIAKGLGKLVQRAQMSEGGVGGLLDGLTRQLPIPAEGLSGLLNQKP
jgi:hypothetical protein